MWVPNPISQSDLRGGGGMKALKRIRLGEALLWLGALFFVVSAMDGKDEAVTLAGLCVLAAIGVRATRPDVVEASTPESSNDAG